MRARFVFLVVAILALAGFAALNWSELARPTQVSFGLTVAEAPLGMIMLGLLFVTVLAFLATAAAYQARYLMDSRQHAKSLQAQRELADKAEASRFSELRHYLEQQQKEIRQREAVMAAEFGKVVTNSQREVRVQLEKIERTLALKHDATVVHRGTPRYERFTADANTVVV